MGNGGRREKQRWPKFNWMEDLCIRNFITKNIADGIALRCWLYLERRTRTKRRVRIEVRSSKWAPRRVATPALEEKSEAREMRLQFVATRESTNVSHKRGTRRTRDQEQKRKTHNT